MVKIVNLKDSCRMNLMGLDAIYLHPTEVLSCFVVLHWDGAFPPYYLYLRAIALERELVG